MGTELRVLIVEDSEDDASLLLRALRKGGYDPIFRQVDTREAMDAALRDASWDVVVSDYSMPSFSGLAALGVLKERGLDLPFIVVSGAIGEEIAVEAMKAGAHDYVMKGNLSRLIPAIQRELGDAEVRRQRRLAESALSESEKRFRRLAENAADIIFRFDLLPEPHFAYVSPAATRITGYTPEDHYADPELHVKLVHPGDTRLTRGMTTAQIVARGDEIRWRHRDGHTIWVEKTTSLVLGEAGGMAAVEGIIRDITERKQLAEQLLRAERLQTAGQIAGQVAHDFNNLLTPLAGYPQLIKRKLPEGHPAIRYCDVMVQSAQTMADINADLLALGRRGHFEQQATDLNQVVEQALDGLSKRPASLRINTSLAPDLLPVKGSPAQLVRVITNLTVNAREAMHDEGELAVRTQNVYVDSPVGRLSRIEVGEYVRLDVSDTGSGVSPEIRNKIFDAFFTTKVSGKRRGSGLGLSVVQAIVEDHNGYVDLESKVGEGSTFSIYLPVSREGIVAGVPAEVTGGSETIMIVDDDPLQREVVADLLRSLGYDVETVSNGEDAVERAAQSDIDLVVLDMIMDPGIDGAETLRRMKAIRPTVRAVIVSGFAETERVREAMSLGAGAFVRKPITLERLSMAVREELDREGLFDAVK